MGADWSMRLSRVDLDLVFGFEVKDNSKSNLDPTLKNLYIYEICGNSAVHSFQKVAKEVVQKYRKSGNQTSFGHKILGI
jgi:hypothetical protein